MIEEKWVRVMFDYCSSGLWEKSGCMMDEDDLPVTSDIKARLKQWVSIYDKHSSESQVMNRNIEDSIDFSEETFSRLDELVKLCEDDFREGISIAMAIKAQLPDWTVKVFNHSSGILNLPEDNHFNSEITSDFRM